MTILLLILAATAGIFLADVIWYGVTGNKPACRRCGCRMFRSDRVDLEPGETFWECPRCDGWQTLTKTPRKHWLSGGKGKTA